jgi:hypothetical protein
MPIKSKKPEAEDMPTKTVAVNLTELTAEAVRIQVAKLLLQHMSPAEATAVKIRDVTVSARFEGTEQDVHRALGTLAIEQVPIHPNQTGT